MPVFEVGDGLGVVGAHEDADSQGSVADELHAHAAPAAARRSRLTVPDEEASCRLDAVQEVGFRPRAHRSLVNLQELCARRLGARLSNERSPASVTIET